MMTPHGLDESPPSTHPTPARLSTYDPSRAAGLAWKLSTRLDCRCNSIALVSRAFLAAHEETAPPTSIVWSVDCRKQPIGRGMLVWFSRISADLEVLEFRNLADNGATCLLPEMLEVAAIAAPKLHTLLLENEGPDGIYPVIRCQAVLERISQLPRLGLLRLRGRSQDGFLPPFSRALSEIVDWRNWGASVRVRVQLEGVEGRACKAQRMYNCLLRHSMREEAPQF